jgi:hypothetical protein
MLPLPAGREASPGGGAFRYARHRPERTLLYQLVEEYYPALIGDIGQTKPLIGFCMLVLTQILHLYLC